MNAKKRYTLIFLISVVFCSAFIVFRKSNRVWRRSTRRNSWHNREIQVDQQRLCFLDEEDEFKDRKSTRLNSSHVRTSRMPSSA